MNTRDGLHLLKGSPVSKWFNKNKKKIESKPSSGISLPPLTKRDLVVRFGRWGIVHNGQIHYAEVRPIPRVLPGEYPKLPLTTDCSGFVTMAYQYADCPDPNGLNYNGQGFTGTLLQHGKKVQKPRPGDIVIYGGGTGNHAALVIAVNGTTMSKIITASHGNESGPYEISVADEAKFQPPGITFISHLP